MDASPRLPQLARIRRRLERERAAAVEITGWLGSGVEALAAALPDALQGRCRPLPADLERSEDGLAAVLREGADRGVRWWILDRRPSAAALRAFERHRPEAAQLIWTTRDEPLDGSVPIERWSPLHLLLREDEIMDLGQQLEAGEIRVDEARRLRRLTDGWFEPLRRILGGEPRRERLPRSVSEVLEIDAVRDFFSAQFLADWSADAIESLRRCAVMDTVPLTEVLRRFADGEDEEFRRLWLGQELLVPAPGGGWRVPRLLAMAVLATGPGRDPSRRGPVERPSISELRRANPVAAIGVSHLAAGEESLHELLEGQWLDMVSSVSIDDMRDVLRQHGLALDPESVGGAALLAGLVAALDRSTNNEGRAPSLAQLAWRQEDALLAAVAELCGQLLRFVEGSWRPVSMLELGEAQGEWPLALRGLHRLHGLAVGFGVKSSPGVELEDAWAALGLSALTSERAMPTTLQELGLRVIATLVAGDLELRRRFETLVSAAGDALRRRFEPWLRQAGAVPVQFRIRLLGPPTVSRQREGEPAETLEGSLHREILLLARLATAGGRGATREELRQVVWPDRSPEFVERNLHPTVSRLRRTLWPAANPTQDPITVRQGVYQLAAEYAWRVDVLDFGDAVTEAEEAARRRRHGAEAACLERACALYGGPFLPGFEEPWPVRVRERVAAQRNAACHRLADLLDASGERGRAVDLLRLALADSPADERAHRRLMELFRASGRRDLVLRQYERLTAALEPLGAVPDEATAALFRELMR